MIRTLLLLLFITIMLFSCGNREDWKNTKTIITEALHDVEPLDDDHAFAYGYGTGNLYKTRDGGVHWKKIHQFDSIFFEQIRFLNDTVGWICGTPNKLYKTENAGKDWIDFTLKQEPNNILIYGMYFKDIENGYVTAVKRDENRKHFSTIYATKDGGRQWELVNTIPDVILNIEEIEGVIYGTGSNIIIDNIDKKEKWNYSFRDTLRKTGGIRDLQISATGKMLATGFSGHILERTDEVWTSKKITSNWLRNLTWVNNTTRIR